MLRTRSTHLQLENLECRANPSVPLLDPFLAFYPALQGDKVPAWYAAGLPSSADGDALHMDRTSSVADQATASNLPVSDEAPQGSSDLARGSAEEVDDFAVAVQQLGAWQLGSVAYALFVGTQASVDGEKRQLHRGLPMRTDRP
jgi:hypothetical protein